MDINYKNILIAFLIGSSWISIIAWFIGFHGYVGKFNENNCIKNMFETDPYFVYTIIAPLYIGCMSALAILISIYTELSVRQSFIIIGLISPIFVSIAIKKCNIYDFTDTRYVEQYFRLICYHFMLYNVLIVNVYKLLV